MCIFSSPVTSVADTRIFAPAAAENAARFIDLSGYPEFFDDMIDPQAFIQIERLFGLRAA